MTLLLTTFFLCLGAAASFGPPGWFVEKSSRHQIRTLFLVCLALLPGGQAAKQQSGKEAAALSVSNATAMAPRTDPQSWEELTSASASSGTIHLSADFEMGDYTKAIDFSGKVLVIWGNNATLDAAKKGRFFSSTFGPNDDDDHATPDTSLELHDLVLQNGQSKGTGLSDVGVEILDLFSELSEPALFAPCGGASHASNFDRQLLQFYVQ